MPDRRTIARDCGATSGQALGPPLGMTPSPVSLSCQPPTTEEVRTIGGPVSQRPTPG